MPTEPRIRRQGTADEAAALAFAAAPAPATLPHPADTAADVPAGAAADVPAGAAADAADAPADTAADTALGTAGVAADAAFGTAGVAADPALGTAGASTDAPGGTADASADVHGVGRDDLARARAERIRGVLDFEAAWSSHGGAKARAIRAEFGWSTTRYYQVLDAALETPDALHHDPMLVRRLLRLRDGA